MANDESGSVAEKIGTQNVPKFVAFLKSMPKCSPEVVRMFSRGDYYTIHGEAAVMVANKFLNTSQAIKMIGSGNDQTESVLISQARYETFLRFLLVENNFRVEIYSKNKQENDWKLKTTASPGCLGELEEIMYNIHGPNVLNQNAAALYLDSKGDVHFALVSIIDCTIHLGSIKDNTSFTLLESLIVRLDPKECLIPSQMANDRIKMMLRKNDILFSEYTPGRESDVNLGSELEKLIKEEYKTILATIVANSRQSLVAFKALLNYLNLLKDPYCYSNYHLKEIEPETFVRLDLSSISNLHLFPKSQDDKSVRSLFQVLNHCRSASGRKLLNTFIRQPLTNLEQIEQRLDTVEFFRDNMVVTSSFHEHFLAKIPDITKIYKKFTNGRCKLKDVYQVYLVVDQLPLMVNTFDPANLPPSIKTTIYDILKEVQLALEPFKKLVLDWIDFEHFNATRELWINANIDEELSSIKEKLNEQHEAASLEAESVRRDLHRNCSIEKDKVKLEIDKFGFYFRLTKQYAPSINRNKLYEQVNTSGAFKDVRFLSKRIKEINGEFVRDSADYDALQQKYIADFIDKTRDYMESILKLESVLAFTDVMVSFCKASQQTIQHYRRPKVFPKGSDRLILKQFRHPIIEIIKDMDFVANDVHFDQSTFKFYVITGPNMGGKSTYIRSVALCVLMAQIGSFVPCDEAEISIVDAIYTRISASDNPTLGLSTFMSEMVEAAAILRSATSHSLIVIDELGRSTGTFDGFGIAQGISQHLANTTRSYTLFATHFHHLAAQISTVGRLVMKTSMEDGTFVNHYQAETGTSENSFGIELAKSAEMPEHVVKRAAQAMAKMQKSLGDDNAYFQRLICKLERELVQSNPRMAENNDQQSYQQYLKEQIRQKLLTMDLSLFADQ